LIQPERHACLVMTTEELEAEHDALLVEHRSLQAEHDVVHTLPLDGAAHVAHIRKLRAHLERLHAYVAALRGKG
jgi:hypothetical protein